MQQLSGFLYYGFICSRDCAQLQLRARRSCGIADEHGQEGREKGESPSDLPRHPAHYG